MKARLLQLWQRLRTSFWFVPGLIAVVMTALAAALVYADAAMQARGKTGLGRFELIGTEGARALLSTIAGSAITVAAMVFSITMVVLNMASAQFGPRLLPNFMRHNATQVVLGTFVGVFTYCMLTLAAVRSDAGQVFVPQTAVAGGLALGVLAVALLIYFIHHVSRFVQTAHVIDDVARSLEDALRSTFSPRTDENTFYTPDDGAEAQQSSHADAARRPIQAPRSGYVQAVDLSGLMTMARDRELVIGLDCRPGHFVIAGRPLAWAAPAGRVDDAAAERIGRAILTGPERTLIQDPEFAVHQLVEVALRALSPGVNDPYTALNCIDRLASALCVLAERVLPSRYLRDAEGRVHVVTDPYTYRGIVEAAFSQIRQSAAGNLAVLLRLLEAVAMVARGDLPAPYREALCREVDAIRDLGTERFPARTDRAAFEERMRAALAALAREP